jgi:hypothetical protein
MSGQPIDSLGLAGAFPRPGWVVIDAVRDAAFTGEVVCHTTPAVVLYADRGRIYSAERSSDAQLGARLVAAGTLTADELELGVLRLGGAEHLGRLFERVATVDRDAVMAATAMLTEQCLAWLAGQHVTGADATPYLHHPSGIHRWVTVDGVVAEAPAPAPSMSPIPTPAPVFAPPTSGSAVFAAPPSGAAVDLPPPSPAVEFAVEFDASPATATDDDLIASLRLPVKLSAPAAFDVPVVFEAEPTPVPTAPASERAPSAPTVDDNEGTIAWDEPGFLDEPLPGDTGFGLLRSLRVVVPETTGDARHTVAFDLGTIDVGSPVDDGGSPDWIDRLDTHGLPSQTIDPFVRSVTLPPLPAEPTDRFELIWPSGEIDEQFGEQSPDAPLHPDRDRGGPTARLHLEGRAKRAAVLQPLAPPDADATGVDTGIGSIEEYLADHAARTAPPLTTPAPPAPPTPTDDVLLAVRQTVAAIEAGSLAPQDRRTGPRVALGAMRSEGASASPPLTATGRMTRPNPAAGSVFDDVPRPAPTAVPDTSPAASAAEPGTERASALRRLIGSLRRR